MYWKLHVVGALSPADCKVFTSNYLKKKTKVTVSANTQRTFIARQLPVGCYWNMDDTDKWHLVCWTDPVIAGLTTDDRLVWRDWQWHVSQFLPKVCGPDGQDSQHCCNHQQVPHYTPLTRRCRSRRYISLPYWRRWISCCFSWPSQSPSWLVQPAALGVRVLVCWLVGQDCVLTEVVSPTLEPLTASPTSRLTSGNTQTRSVMCGYMSDILHSTRM